MKILKGQNCIPLPETIEDMRVGIFDEGGILWVLHRVPFRHFNNKTLGKTEEFFFLTGIDGTSSLFLLPTPDTDIEIRVEYWPARKVV